MFLCFLVPGWLVFGFRGFGFAIYIGMNGSRRKKLVVDEVEYNEEDVSGG